MTAIGYGIISVVFLEHSQFFIYLTLSSPGWMCFLFYLYLEVERRTKPETSTIEEPDRLRSETFSFIYDLEGDIKSQLKYINEDIIWPLSARADFEDEVDHYEIFKFIKTLSESEHIFNDKDKLVISRGLHIQQARLSLIENEEAYFSRNQVDHLKHKSDKARALSGEKSHALRVRRSWEKSKTRQEQRLAIAETEEQKIACKKRILEAETKILDAKMQWYTIDEEHELAKKDLDDTKTELLNWLVDPATIKPLSSFSP